MGTPLWVPLVILVIVAVTAFALWAYLTARRLDRLHIRLDRSRDALQAALDRRCAVIAVAVPELAARARAAELIELTPRNLSDRLEAEDALRADVDKRLLGGEREGDLEDADTRVMLALRFYNEAVSDTRAVRLTAPVRLLRLGGTAELPEYASLSAASV